MLNDSAHRAMRCDSNCFAFDMLLQINVPGVETEFGEPKTQAMMMVHGLIAPLFVRFVFVALASRPPLKDAVP